MPKQHFKYNTGSTITNTIQKGIHSIATEGTQDWGPTSVTGFYPETTPPSGGYTIYYMRPSGGPSVHVANNDTQAISFLKSFGSTGSTISDVLTWASNTANYYVQTGATTGIITSGLTLNLDAGNLSSYSGTGTSWYDISGNNNNATLTSYGAGVPSYSSLGGGAILFTRNAYNIGNSAIFQGGSSFANLTTAVSLSVWFYTGTNTTMILAGKGYQFDTTPYEIQSYQINIDGGTINARITANGSTNNTDLTSSSLSLNTWTNVTLTYDGSNIKIYINGTLANSTAKSGLMTNIYSLPFVIGGQSVNLVGTTKYDFYNGYIGQVLLYNTALTSGQILQNFNATKTRFGL
jgi:hypothetical protein